MLDCRQVFRRHTKCNTFFGCKLSEYVFQMRKQLKNIIKANRSVYIYRCLVGVTYLFTNYWGGGDRKILHFTVLHYTKSIYKVICPAHLKRSLLLEPAKKFNWYKSAVSLPMPFASVPDLNQFSVCVCAHALPFTSS